jgi:hypothetical protein
MFCTSLAHAQGFDGTPKLKTKRGGVEHAVLLSNWHVDAKGVPSFDYVYEQHGGACHFRLAGHAEAMVEEVRGKIELVVFNPQDGKGRSMPQTVAYDSDDVTFSLPFKGRLNQIGLRSPMPPALRARACDKGDDEGLAITFGQ